jgi:hypothetical protein
MRYDDEDASDDDDDSSESGDYLSDSGVQRKEEKKDASMNISDNFGNISSNEIEELVASRKGKETP